MDRPKKKKDIIVEQPENDVQKLCMRLLLILSSLLLQLGHRRSRLILELFAHLFDLEKGHLDLFPSTHDVTIIVIQRYNYYVLIKRFYIGKKIPNLF